MPRTKLWVEFIPPTDEVAETYHDVAERFQHSKRGFAKMVDILEDAHERHFRRLRGRYVLTGATRASLTGTAPGAIRLIEDGQLKFGTEVWYAHFLTKAPKDYEGGQIGKDESGKGRSAVVVFPKSTHKQISKALLDWIMEAAE